MASLAGRTLWRPIGGGAFGGLVFLVLLSRLASPHLPAKAPPPDTPPLASRVVSAAVAPADVQIQAPLSRAVRTVPLYIPTAMLPKAEPRPTVMPVVLNEPEPQKPRLQAKPPPSAKKRYRRASLGGQKPAGRFARFCAGSGRDRYSWMRVNGRKRYCK